MFTGRPDPLLLAARTPASTGRLVPTAADTLTMLQSAWDDDLAIDLPFGLPFCHGDDLHPDVAALSVEEGEDLLREITDGAYLPAENSSDLPAFFVAVWHSLKRCYQVMPVTVGSYSEAEGASADLNARAESYLKPNRAYDRVLGYRPPYVRFMPMTREAWQAKGGNDSQRNS